MFIKRDGNLQVHLLCFELSEILRGILGQLQIINAAALTVDGLFGNKVFWSLILYLSGVSFLRVR